MNMNRFGECIEKNGNEEEKTNVCLRSVCPRIGVRMNNVLMLFSFVTYTTTMWR